MTERRSPSGEGPRREDRERVQQSYVPILVLDLDGASASELADTLRQRSFNAAFVTNCREALTAISANDYGTLVVIADLSRVDDLRCLAALRKQAPRAWIITISARPHSEAQHVIFQHGADSLLTVPFSIDDLTFRLWAFSQRSRPI